MTAWKCQTTHFVSLLHAAAHNSVCSLGHHSGTILSFAVRFLTWQKCQFHRLFRLEKGFYNRREFTFFIAGIAISGVIRRQVVSLADPANPHEMGVSSNLVNKPA